MTYLKNSHKKLAFCFYYVILLFGKILGFFSLSFDHLYFQKKLYEKFERFETLDDSSSSKILSTACKIITKVCPLTFDLFYWCIFIEAQNVFIINHVNACILSFHSISNVQANEHVKSYRWDCRLSSTAKCGASKLHVAYISSFMAPHVYRRESELHKRKSTILLKPNATSILQVDPNKAINNRFISTTNHANIALQNPKSARAFDFIWNAS